MMSDLQSLSVHMSSQTSVQQCPVGRSFLMAKLKWKSLHVVSPLQVTCSHSGSRESSLVLTD